MRKKSERLDAERSPAKELGGDSPRETQRAKSPDTDPVSPEKELISKKARDNRLEELRADILNDSEKGEPAASDDLLQRIHGMREENYLTFFDSLGVEDLSRLVKEVEDREEAALSRYQERFSSEKIPKTRWQKFLRFIRSEQQSAPNYDRIKRDARPAWSPYARNRLVHKLLELSEDELRERILRNPSQFEQHAIRSMVPLKDV